MDREQIALTTIARAKMEYVFNSPGQPLEPISDNFGLCDPAFRGIRQGAEPWRYGTAWIRVRRSAGPPVRLIVDPQEPVIFTNGIGETAAASTGAPANFPLTSVETDANKEGALIKENQHFVITALGFEVLRGLVFTNTAEEGDPPAYALDYDQWWDAYQQRFHEVMSNQTSPQIVFNDEACKYDASLLSFWPQHANSVGSRKNQLAWPVGPATITPTRRPILSGSRDNVDQVEIHLRIPHTLRFGEDNVVPVPSDLTVFYVPIQLIAFGFPVCDPCWSNCAPGPIPDEMYMAMVAELVRRGAIVPSGGQVVQQTQPADPQAAARAAAKAQLAAQIQRLSDQMNQLGPG